RELASSGSGGAPVFSSVAFDLVVPNVWLLGDGQVVNEYGPTEAIRTAGRVSASIGRVTWSGGGPTGPWTSWAASTTK
ncbi:hypothetical protein, partial [Streptomyces sp. NRRL B-1347]|uniref:hypothetical protein n=1 Tax=Streptomyces sp. NRRL B-1347 TaxID=1476877 RepID=UPI001F35B07C